MRFYIKKAQSKLLTPLFSRLKAQSKLLTPLFSRLKAHFLHLKAQSKLLISLISLFLAFLMFVGAVAAWFVFSQRSNHLFVYVGNIDLDCEVFVARDELDSSGLAGSDGVPDLIQFPPPEPLSRSSNLAQNYITIQEAKEANKILSGSESFKGIYVGRQILYKIVVKNNSKTKNPALISVSFADLTQYFGSLLALYLQSEGQDEQAYQQVFAASSARLLFGIRARKAIEYSDPAASSKFDTVIRETSLEADQSVLPVWRYSKGEASGEYFFDSVRLDYQNLLELDFALSCDFLTDELNKYILSAPQLYAHLETSEQLQGYSSSQIQTAITELATKESLYIIKNNDSGMIKKLEFDINSIVIKGKQQQSE